MWEQPGRCAYPTVTLKRRRAWRKKGEEALTSEWRPTTTSVLSNGMTAERSHLCHPLLDQTHEVPTLVRVHLLAHHHPCCDQRLAPLQAGLQSSKDAKAGDPEQETVSGRSSILSHPGKNAFAICNIFLYFTVICFTCILMYFWHVSWLILF